MIPIPDVELDHLLRAVRVAGDLAQQGNPGAGFQALRAVHRRTQDPEAAGAPWRTELARLCEDVMQRFEEQYPPARRREVTGGAGEDLTTTVPACELDLLDSAVQQAVEHASLGSQVQGYTTLLRGLRRAQTSSAMDGESWAAELIARYRTALHDYCESYGPRLG